MEPSLELVQLLVRLQVRDQDSFLDEQAILHGLDVKKAWGNSEALLVFLQSMKRGSGWCQRKSMSGCGWASKEEKCEH